ncbi:MAG: DUF4242 domain-containing protein [Acidimicrobiales bacterium]
MPKFLIERHLPGAGSLSDDELCAISEKSNRVLSDLGGDVQWLHSYVTDNALHCVYIAPDADRVREHATRGGFPANAVLRVARVIDPTTGGA